MAPPSSLSPNRQRKGSRSSRTPASALRGGREGKVPFPARLCEGRGPLPEAASKRLATCDGGFYCQFDGLMEAQIAGQNIVSEDVCEGVSGRHW